MSLLSFSRSASISSSSCVITSYSIHYTKLYEFRVAEKTGNGWHVNQWLKKAVLLSFSYNFV